MEELPEQAVGITLAQQRTKLHVDRATADVRHHRVFARSARVALGRRSNQDHVLTRHDLIGGSRRDRHC